MTIAEGGPDAARPRIVLAGVVSGPAEVAALAGLVDAGASPVIVDAQGLRAFTSSGIQAWIEVLRTLRARDVQLVFERCSPAIVRQTMSIHGFLINATVRSVVAPYLCPACDREEEVVVEAGETSGLAATHRCACGAQMEFDDLPEPYVVLLARATQDR